jgi:hypothetical protein
MEKERENLVALLLDKKYEEAEDISRTLWE